ncbi:Med5 domain-containing protein [Rhizoctonia solani AG-1 IA]|uniref:Mediator of RNA polymerase II transcription subunit 5 n=1 Tax=Thanatephorus cucumeris (strain AG1-IA) TaxID=983506 RepID=L8WXV6_THACA|nr:Med5 domain-containing protein [Rhizoctonia solani AG-1 IA]
MEQPTVNDITKAAFLSGYPAENWLAIVQQLKPHGPSNLPASEICASIFSLLEAYPLSPVLLQYLCVALDSESPHPVLPIGIYISTLIAWSQTILASPTDQTTQLLSALCAIAAPRVQKPSANLTPTLPTAQGCVSLVQHVSLTHDAILTSSALDILLAILKTVVASSPNPNLSPFLALNLVPAINDLLDAGEIVSPQLTNWLFQLSALTTADGHGHGHATSRVQPQQVTDEPPQRPELLEFTRNGPLFDVLAYQVTSVLAYPDSHLSALQTVFNSTPTPDAFFSQLYASLISVLANEPDGNTRTIICAALFGSVRHPGPPRTTCLLTHYTPSCPSSFVNSRHHRINLCKDGVQSAIHGLFTHFGALLDKCDVTAPITRVSREDSMEEDVPEDGSKGKNIRTMLVQSLQSVSLLDSNFPSLPGLTIENWPGRGIGRVFAEAGENGQDLEVSPTSAVPIQASKSWIPQSDKLELIDRAVADPETHACLCTVLHKGYTSLTTSTQHLSPATLESLANLSRLLYTHPTVLDVVGLRVPPAEFVAAGLAFLEDLEGAGVGDPQSALGQYGDVLLLLQLLVTRYEVRTQFRAYPVLQPFGSCQMFQQKSGTLKHGDRVLDASCLTSSWAVYNLSDLTEPERTLISDWVKAAFDSNSFGIDDNVLRSTNPRVLLKLSATLFTEAIRKCAAEPEGAGMEILRNGVSYFEGPLLNWTLRGVIWALANEAERHGHAAQTHLDVLQLLVLANGCPAPVIEMTRHRVLRLLASPYIPKANIDVNAMLRVLHPSNSGSGSGSTNTTAPLYASSYLNLALQASIGGTPIPNPARILGFTNSLELLRAPVQQGSDSVAHRNILIALLTLARPRFAGIKSVLSALRSLAGTMDPDFLAGVVAGSVSVWVAAPMERALAREKVKKFVNEGEKEKGLEGIVKRMVGVEGVRRVALQTTTTYILDMVSNEQKIDSVGGSPVSVSDMSLISDVESVLSLENNKRFSMISSTTFNDMENTPVPVAPIDFPGTPIEKQLPVHPDFAYEDGNIEFQKMYSGYMSFNSGNSPFSPDALTRQGRKERLQAPVASGFVRRGVVTTLVVPFVSFIRGDVFSSAVAPKFNSDTLISALRVGTRYGCPDMRNFAITQLESRFQSPPIDRIKLSDEFNIPNWAIPAFIELCQRTEPISQREARILGAERLVEVSRIREAEQRRKFIQLVDKSMGPCGVFEAGQMTDDKLRDDASEIFVIVGAFIPLIVAVTLQRTCDDTDLNNRPANPNAFTSNNRHSISDPFNLGSLHARSGDANGSRYSVVPCQIHMIAPRIITESLALFKRCGGLTRQLGDLKVAVSNGAPQGAKQFSVEDEIQRATWIRKTT